MRWLVCLAVIAFGSSAVADQPPGQPGVVVLASPRQRAREEVLVDALRIYMRSLGRPVLRGGPAPTSLAAEELARAGEEGRRLGGEVVVWFGERPAAAAVAAPATGALLYALRLSTGELRETAAGSDDPLQAARALALKVRALIAVRAIGPDWAVVAEAPPPSPPAAPPEVGPDDQVQAPESIAPPVPAPTPPPADAAPSPPRAPSPPASAIALEAARPGARRTWLEASAAYGVLVPTTPAWVRHGLTVRLAMPWGRLPLAAFADASFTTEPSTVVDGSTVAARIWPVAVGVSWRLRWPRWQLALGPRASLQIIDASAATSDGRTGAARRYSAGLGLLAEVAWLFSRHVGAVVSVGAEALLPRIQLATGGSGATDLGWVQFAFSAGALFSIP